MADFSFIKKGSKSTMMKNISGYFSITTEPNGTMFYDKSNRIQFYGQWRSPWANRMNYI